MEVQLAPTGVIYFYLNGDDIENHKRVIQFMMDNDLIRKNKTDRYYSDCFKFDDQPPMPMIMVLILKGTNCGDLLIRRMGKGLERSTKENG